MTDEARDDYILNWIRPDITVEQQIREVLPLAAGELGNDYAAESHIRSSRYVADVRWLLREIDRMRQCFAQKLREYEATKRSIDLERDQLRAELDRTKSSLLAQVNRGDVAVKFAAEESIAFGARISWLMSQLEAATSVASGKAPQVEASTGPDCSIPKNESWVNRLLRRRWLKKAS